MEGALGRGYSRERPWAMQDWSARRLVWLGEMKNGNRLLRVVPCCRWWRAIVRTDFMFDWDEKVSSFTPKFFTTWIHKFYFSIKIYLTVTLFSSKQGQFPWFHLSPWVRKEGCIVFCHITIHTVKTYRSISIHAVKTYRSISIWWRTLELKQCKWDLNCTQKI